MKVTLESTDRFSMVNGVKCRVWEGETEGGVKCYALIPIISHHRMDDATEFARDLQEHKPASNQALLSFPRLGV